MSKQCKIIEDLLPLYHDGVCSEESREMVDEHLAQCEDCRKSLELIDGELLSPTAEDSDVDLLKSLTKKIILRQRKALMKGFAITLAFVLAIFLYNTILWYAQEYSYYTPFTEGLTQIPPDPPPETVRFYQKMDDTYSFSVVVPNFLSREGYVRIKRNDQSGRNFFEVRIRQTGYTEHAFHVSILCKEPDIYHLFAIDSDLTLNQWYYRHKSDSEKAQIQAELDEHREEIQDMIDAAKAVWPFLK